MNGSAAILAAESLEEWGDKVMFACLNGSAAILAGLETTFDTIESGVHCERAQVKLALINDSPSDTSDVVVALRHGLLGDKQADTYTSGLGRRLQEAAESGETTIQIIKQAVYDHWGSYLYVEHANLNGN